MSEKIKIRGVETDISWEDVEKEISNQGLRGQVSEGVVKIFKSLFEEWCECICSVKLNDSFCGNCHKPVRDICSMPTKPQPEIEKETADIEFIYGQGMALCDKIIKIKIPHQLLDAFNRRGR